MQLTNGIVDPKMMGNTNFLQGDILAQVCTIQNNPSIITDSQYFKGMHRAKWNLAALTFVCIIYYQLEKGFNIAETL